MSARCRLPTLVDVEGSKCRLSESAVHPIRINTDGADVDCKICFSSAPRQLCLDGLDPRQIHITCLLSSNAGPVVSLSGGIKVARRAPQQLCLDVLIPCDFRRLSGNICFIL